MLLSAPPIVIIESRPNVFATIAAIAPAFCTFFTFTVKSHRPRSMSAIMPASDPGIASQALVVGSVPSLASARSPVTPCTVGGAPQPAVPWARKVAGLGEFTTTSFTPLPVQRYICIRGLTPSLGVAKFALSMPPPSWPSAFTESLSLPPLVPLRFLKIARRLCEPVAIQLIVYHVVQIKEVLDCDLAVRVG